MDEQKDISDHFTWEDVVRSDTAARLGIDNTLPEELKPAAINTSKGMESVRALLGKPIYVSSWYRCLELNEALKSKPTSQHIKAEAVDFTSPKFGTPLEVCSRILKYPELIKFDQLILEHTWVHISFSAIPGVKQRGQVLSLLSSGKYALGLTDKSGVPYGNA